MTYPAIYATLDPSFLEAMDEIGHYGAAKYPSTNVVQCVRRGDRSRHERTTTEAIGQHIKEHYHAHRDGITHDHFHTRRHQLAAVAFNAMMEYLLSGFDEEA